MSGLPWKALSAALLMIAGCSQTGNEDDPSSNSAQTEAAGSNSAQSSSTAQAPSQKEPAPRPPENPAEEQLQSDIRSLAKSFDGSIGIAVRDLRSDWTAHSDGQEMFPQQSVSKLWVAIAALDQVDRGQLDLSEKVTLRREDLTLFYQPIRRLILRGENGYTTTLEDLLQRAIARSDNTANDFLLRRIGGPEAVRAMLRSKGLGGIRFGAGERELQSEIAGLEWKPDYSTDRGFFEARRDVPTEKRRVAFEAYIEDPMDGATPVGIVNALAKLKQGKLLSPESTERLLSVMERTKSGPRRLKGGLQPGWSIAHKTGTGQEFRGSQAGYNDVGLLTSPDGRNYSVAVLIGRTSQPVPTRMSLMQDVTRAVIDYDARR